MQVAAILGHELLHAAVGVAASHKAFRRVASGIGLAGQMAATAAGPEFKEGHAANTGSCRAAATWQTSASHWRQQPFQQTQQAVLPAGQVRL
jgi:hypothetical protein